MSELALKIQDYYIRGLWTIERVNKALELSKITQEEYDQITNGEK